MLRMSRHPSSSLVEIVGIENGKRGRSCEEHDVCGNALQIDSVVRFRTIQIVNGNAMSIFSVYFNAF